MTGGRADVGAGAFVPADSQLTIYSGVVSDNVATTSGGGIATAGTLFVYRSLVASNQAGAGTGGGISVEPGGSGQVFSSTVSGNTAAAGGGVASQSFLQLLNATVANNGGGGAFWTGAGVTPTLWNTILAGNTGGACGGAVTQRQGWQANIADDASCAFAAGEGTGSIDPLLGPLRNNRGPTDTHALQALSPAIDAGAADLCSIANVDQRGAQAVGPCDVGAFEYRGVVPEPVLPPPEAGRDRERVAAQRHGEGQDPR